VGRGKKRVWAGSVLLGLAVVAGAVIVASRSYSVRYAWPEHAPGVQRIIGFSRGLFRWENFNRGRNVHGVPPGWSVHLTPPQSIELLVPDHLHPTAFPGRTGFHCLRLVSYFTEYGGSSTSFDMVAWPVPLLFAGGGAVFFGLQWRDRRRVRQGRCFRCGYDLAATPGPAPCPECGAQRVESETGCSMMNAPGTS
jgi:hypothetical protein